MKTIFSEKQKFNQWWIWVIIIALAVLPFIEIVKPFLISDEKNIAKINLSSIAILLIPVILIILLFLLLELKTKITAENLSFKYFPFIKKNYAWSEIASAAVIDYGFVGGWGIRLWTKYGTVYNVKGNKGLHIKLKNGKQFIVGTQKADELSIALKSLKF